MPQSVDFQTNGGRTSGYLALPSKPGPGLIIIQEWWGLVPHIQHIADRFAAAGFVALAPDLYHGHTAKSPDEAGKLMMSLKIDQAARDLGGAIDYLKSRSEVVRPKIGTVGFCMGGALSLFAACDSHDIGACAIFYGGHPNVKPNLEALSAPVLGIYASHDNFVSPEVVAHLDHRLTALGKRHEFHTYDADHAFFNDTRPEVYNAEAAADAWAKTVAFFTRELQP